MNRMLKYAAGLMLLMFCGAPLMALQAGDPAAELRADFVFRGPVTLTGPVDAPATGRTKVLVFFRPRLPESRNLMNYLMDLKVRYPQIDFVAVSPDGKAEAKEFFGIYRHNSFAGAADVEMQSSKAYLSGQPSYPYAFIIDGPGTILWDGEAADLSDALALADRKMLDVEVQKKLSPLLADLRSRFRNGEERMAHYAAEKIFALDPGNSAAIRIRLFMLQGAGRYQEAWALLEARRKAAPKTMKLYFLQLELISGMGADEAQIRAVAEAYRDQIAVNLAGDSAMAWQLMVRRPFDAAALRIAGQLIGRAMAFRMQTKPRQTAADADLYTSAALYSYRLGKPDKAAALQKKAAAVLENAAPHRLQASQKMEQYYRDVLSLTSPRK